MIQFAFNPNHLRVIRALSAKAEVFVVGGAVRDAIAGVPCHDIDFAVGLKSFKELKDALEDRGLKITPDQTAAEHGIARVIDPIGKELIDVAIFRTDIATDGRHAVVQFTDNIVDDLARRDLTINAIGCAIRSNGGVGDLFDPFGGREDLMARRVVLVGDPEERIKEDRLRMLRVARFATKMGIETFIDPATVQACRKYASEVHQVSAERIREEILKAMVYPESGWMFRYMNRLGLVKEILPDHFKGVYCGQNKHHKDDVFEHLCLCVDACRGKKFHPLLKLATFFHDVAKPHTKKMLAGDATFHNHETVGATIAYEWMKKYKFSNNEINYVVKMVRHHQWRFEENTTDKTYRKWLQEVGKKEWRDLIRLRMADRGGNRAKAGRPLITREMKTLIRKVRNIIRTGQPIFQEDLAINGDDIKAMGLKPGPVYKTIFSNMMGIVMTDPAKNTREWLTDYVTRNYINKTS